MRDTEPRAVILVGVSGSGKSTVGGSLAQRLAALERPSDAIVVDARLPFQDVVEQIVNALKEKQPAKDG
jgi:shikimate kinase